MTKTLKLICLALCAMALGVVARANLIGGAVQSVGLVSGLSVTGQLDTVVSYVPLPVDLTNGGLSLASFSQPVSESPVLASSDYLASLLPVGPSPGDTGSVDQGGGVTPVPDAASTLILVGMALLGLVLLRRFRAKALHRKI